MTSRFKGIDLNGRLEKIIPHMAVAEKYGGELQDLQAVWDNLSLLGQLSGSGADMSDTRGAFSELATSLLNQLGTEALKKCILEIGFKAQVAINVLVRNLFERTADIGFLSSDEDIRAFLRIPRDSADRNAARDALRRRFNEYVQKYSVYFDIILTDPHGNIVARLDEGPTVVASSDPLIHEAITTPAGYVESFGESDLVPNQKHSLIYAFRVSDDGGSVLGVLCLCFRFVNEMELIFSNLVGQDDWTVVTILDAAGFVIASSDQFHIPIGARLTPALNSDFKIVKFGAMEYLATSRAAQPYQGYGGPKWYGHAMVPLEHAFDTDESAAHPDIEPEFIKRITHASNLFSGEIRQIPSKAGRILRELNRSVWNGSVRQSDASESKSSGFSRILLKEISDTGAKTKNIFEGSIADLHHTVVTSLLRDDQFHAALAIDIMDRNLYERANDCRWWALAPIFADFLSRPERSAQSAEAVASVLRAINSLYTVYTNLIVFDGNGKVVATSNAAKSNLAGATLREEWVARVLGLQNEQEYSVSAFVPTPLYDDRATYIYGAAILSPQNRKAVGGIGIVFDSEPQFAAMLKDALPRDDANEIREGAFGAFVEPGGRVIACSDDHFRPGDQLSIDDRFLSLDPGVGISDVTVIDGVLYAVGAKTSTGYREYKNGQDGYENAVTALIFTRLCDANVEARDSNEVVRRPSIRSDRMQAGTKEDLATVLIGRQWYAVRASEVIEAIDSAGIVPLPFMPANMAGCAMHRGSTLPVLDLGYDLEPNAERVPLKQATRQIVVMTSAGGARFGLLVDGLGEIVEVLTGRLADLPPMVANQNPFGDATIAVENGDNGRLLMILRAERLYAGISVAVNLAVGPDVRASGARN
jgi:chemotaxis signal transduction protein